MPRLRLAVHSVFRSIGNPGYRKFLAGQAVSSMGTWMQTVAQGLLVLALSGKGVNLGLTVLLQVAPMALLSPIAGVWADRVDKRALLLATNTIAGAQALLLGVLVAGDQATLPIVYVMALVLGIVSAVQLPTQQSFVAELVVGPDLANAVNVNLMTMNVARVIGPAVAGLTVATAGIAMCFFLNAASFLAVIVALIAIRATERTPAPRQQRQSGQLRDGIAHVRRNPELAGAWWMNLVYCMLAWEFEVSVPLLVTQTFGASPGTYGLMFAALGAGAVVGGAWGASRHHPSHRDQLLAALVSGAGLLGTALAPNLYVAFVTVAIGGGAIVCWWGILSGIYQLEIDASFRARATALWLAGLQAGRPAGALLVGVVAQQFGARAPFVLGAFGCVLAIVVWSRVSGHGVRAALASRAPVSRVRNEEAEFEAHVVETEFISEP
ncbi:MAG: MFS transporter [Acidimicrobiia bacterium]